MLGRIKSKIIKHTKSNKLLYNLYYYLGSFVINLFKKFIIPNDKLILFISYGGENYDDSPREIFNYILNDNRFKKYKLVWAFRNPSDFFMPKGVKKIKTDTIKYYILALKARVWVTNVVVERGLEFKGKNTLYFCTWHGTPIKKIGKDMDSKNGAFVSKSNSNFDYMCAQGEYDAQVFQSAFQLDRNKIAITGLPRNDELAVANYNVKNNLKKSMCLPNNKKVILYAPTFREYNNYVMKPPIDFEKWDNELGEEYVLLIKAHHAILKSMKFPEKGNFVYDVTNNYSLNELMIVSDLLISDYSSIYFDYSILGKPMLAYVYDFEEYKQKRGLYFNLENSLPCKIAKSEDNLISEIINLDYDFAVSQTKKFREKYIQQYGNSTKLCVDKIASEVISNGEVR